MEARSHSAGDAEVRFGPFELNLRAGELYKDGRKIRLQEQPFQILQMLLESPGDVVSREDIRKRLWPDNTVVEFDHSINAAVKRLRDALRDFADRPRYIETVARRGYRFIGNIDTAASVVLPNEPTNGRAEPVPPGPRFHLRPWIFVLGLAAVLLMGWAGVEYSRRSMRPGAAPLRPLMRLDLDLGDELPPASDHGSSAILSPDGTRLVYISHSRLFVRQLDQPNASELPGTENSQAPFFSPDGQWVGFFSQGVLKKVSLKGGVATTVGECPLANGASWGEDGSIVAACNLTLVRLPSAGGAFTPVSELAPGEIVHRWPQILPGGKAVLFAAYRAVTGLEGAAIEVLSFKDHRRKTLVRGGAWARYLGSGHLAYIDKGALLAAPFDLERMELRGTSTPVLEEVAYSSAWGSAQLDASRTGTLVYRSSRTGQGLVSVQWLDASGHTRPLLPVPGNYLSPTVSPDGRRLALTSAGDIWVYEMDRGSMTRLTFGGGYGNPLWSVDSRYILFRAARGMLWTRADGSAQPQVLTQSANQQTPWSFTPDGNRLAFAEIDPGTGADIWTLPVQTSLSGLRAGKPEVFLQTPFHERAPMFSPDGRWLAYISNESGEYQVYVEAFPHKGPKRQVSTGGGTFPAWSRNGNELFFLNLAAERHIMESPYRVYGDSFVAESPHAYSYKAVSFETTRSYDPAPDGKHVVALMAADGTQASQDRVVFLLNFFDELGRRAPANAN